MIPDKVGHNDIYYTHEFTLNLLSNFWKFYVKLKDLKICVLLEEKGIEFKKCFFFPPFNDVDDTFCLFIQNHEADNIWYGACNYTTPLLK